MTPLVTTVHPLDINNPTKEILKKEGGSYNPDKPGVDPNVSTTTSSTTTTTTTINPNSNSIVPASGFYGPNWPQKFVIPQSLSSAGWTNEAKGYAQQTFLGASIRNFTMTGGFGDSSSSLTVDLVVDEYNPSDLTSFGYGDDIYHSGVWNINGKLVGDKFVPPIPGSPVFFKFGEHFATVEDAYKKTFDQLYMYATITDEQPGVGSEYSMQEFLLGSGITLSDNQYLALEEPKGQTKIINTEPRPVKDYNGLRAGPNRGKDHIVFGGILQTYTQSRNSNGNPLYTVNVLDPREILSNVTLILNDYAGSTYDQYNVLNLYGFLEYNPSEATKNHIKSFLPNENKLEKIIQKSGPKIGSSIFKGDDRYYQILPNEDTIEQQKNDIKETEKLINAEKRKISDYRIDNDIQGALASLTQINLLNGQLLMQKMTLANTIRISVPSFPMTGSGFSRRGPQGIPYYRIKDAINALMENEFTLPAEYKNQGFGKKINFRGFNYIVDFGGLPDLPKFYYMDFDQINLLELALEICDITNRDLYVSLLPVINHPACAKIYQFNQSASNEDLIAGIIRLDTIDRSDQPMYGAVKTYIDGLINQGIYVENQDLGYELSNVTTDKFVIGAQEINTYFFSANNDRDGLAFRKTGKNNTFPNKSPGYEWTLEAALNQQILPYYGKLGNGVTIPKGFGAYQQILLDASHLNAAGVGNYYVATEMELRCALVSFDRWKAFLQQYNDTYLDSIEIDDTADIAIAGLTPQPKAGDPPLPVNVSDTYVVSVPRSVFNTYAKPIGGSVYGADGLPLSPCNPPYGYPLYYKRMTKIGIPEGGLTDLYTRWNTVLTNYAELQSSNKENVVGILNSQFTRLKQLKESTGLTAFEQTYLNNLENVLKDPTPKKIEQTIALIENNVESGRTKNIFAIMTQMARKNTQNALKVYNFVRTIAEECLGKKFLVKIPNKVNLLYNSGIVCDPSVMEYKSGPFGFPPLGGTPESISAAASKMDKSKTMIENFLYSGIDPSQANFIGGLSINYNPIIETYESNYVPTNVGGYFPYNLYQNTLGASDIRDISNTNAGALPLGVKHLLVPQDPTNFINEDGRISSYVRFDHSEFLSVESLSDSDYCQQLITADGMIPDLSDHLDNTGPDKLYSFPKPKDANNQTAVTPPSQVLFVKCSVDEDLKMPPKVIKSKTLVHAQIVKDIGTKSLPNKIFIPCGGPAGTGEYVDSFSYYKAHFVPLPQPGQQVEILDFAVSDPATYPGGASLNNHFIIDTSVDKLDTSHAYALITLPARVVPTMDSRLRDGPNQTVAAERFKHMMTMDTVRGLPGFALPTNPPVTAPASPLKTVLDTATVDSKIHAWLAMKKAQSNVSMAFPYRISVTSPSPVYPDLVALSLLSKDRCYGPWISSRIDSKAYVLKNIGGRVDFIKDENLSPWNYGGYDLLNQAGRLQAEFSNSLLLFSERGSFTVASIPSGNSLCKALVYGGPLVTSISVDVSDRGCRTTYQMDLYTASFGKLQKQKQELISKISRDRKKLISERNALIRKGLGKNQNRRNFSNEYDMLSRGIAPGLNDVGMGMANAYTRIVLSTNSSNQNVWSSTSGNMVVNTNSIEGAIQQDSDMAKAMQLMSDQFAVAEKYQNTGSAEISELFIPFSHGYHPNMSYMPFSYDNARGNLYDQRGEV